MYHALDTTNLGDKYFLECGITRLYYCASEAAYSSCKLIWRYFMDSIP